ncbi:MAG: hypothetical protein QX197_05845 [Methylococcaceae bacterium]
MNAQFSCKQVRYVGYASKVGALGNAFLPTKWLSALSMCEQKNMPNLLYKYVIAWLL